VFNDEASMESFMLEDEFKKKVMLDEAKEDEAERIRIKRKKKGGREKRKGKTFSDK